MHTLPSPRSLPYLLASLLAGQLAACANDSAPPRADAAADAAPMDQRTTDGAAPDAPPDATAGDGPLADAASCPAIAGRAWVLRELDPIGGAPIYPELAIDPASQRPVAAFRKGNKSDRYAVVSAFDGQGWSPPEVIEQAAGKHLGKRPSLAIDHSGGLHVTAYDEDGLRLRYGHKPPGGAWSVETLFADEVPAADAGDHSSLVLDRDQGALRVTFLQYGSYRVIYGAQQGPGAGWTYEPVTGSGRDPVRGSSSSLALDSKGQAHVAYYTGKHLHYATRAAGGWTVEVVDATNDKIGHYPTLALDPASGTPQVVYLDWSKPSALRFARRDPAKGWQVETIDDDLGITYTTAMVRRPCGATLLLYVRNESDSGRNGLWLAARAGDDEPFSLHLVDDRSLVSGVALAATPSGHLHAIYLDETSYVLKHAELPR